MSEAGKSKTKNKLIDLNNSLFSTLEDLDTAETPEEIEKYIRIAKAKTEIAAQVISNGNLVLKAATLMNEYLMPGTHMPDIFGVSLPPTALDSKSEEKK